MGAKQAFRHAIAMRMFQPLITNDQIAQQIGRDVTTVQRWFRELRRIAEENMRDCDYCGENVAP